VHTDFTKLDGTLIQNQLFDFVFR